jgi:hypothetical protein
VSHGSVQRVVSSAFARGWEKGSGKLAMYENLRRQPAAAVRRTYTLMREAMPTIALRHAGGSWLDVLSHPAFRLELRLMHSATTKEAAAVHRVPMACRPYLHNSQQASQQAASAANAAKRGMGPHLPTVGQEVGHVGNVGSGGLYGVYGGAGGGGKDSMSMVASFVSTSGALRHAGCSWFDVARHTAFHACVRSRVWTSGYAMYLATFVKHPFTTALVTSVTKCVASDVAVQYFIEGRDELDMKRVVTFAILGLVYVGAFQYGLYNNLMKPLGGVLTTMWGTGASVGTMVAIDTLLVCPFIYLPAFYGLKLWANGECTLAETPAKISEKLRGSFGGGGDAGKEGMGMLTLVALWAYWMPAQAINFWVVPRHLTIPFMNVLGFFWNGIMSAMNGADDREKEAARGGGSAVGGITAAAGEGGAAAAWMATATATEEERRARRAVAVAAVAADAVAAAAASADVKSGVADTGAVRDCLQDAGCLQAISLASMDALAIARVGAGAGATRAAAAA